LFLDETSHNCVPIHTSLDTLKIEYVRHGSLFESGADDEVWLPVVGQKRWAVLTCDKRIRYNQLEREKIMEHGIREFVFTSGNLNGETMGSILKIAASKMQRLFAQYPPPFIATISQSGSVTVRYDKDGAVDAKAKEGKENKAGQNSTPIG
jgi:hypothetical protein